MRFYYYSSAGPVFDGPWNEGATNVVLPDGRSISRLVTAIPEWGVYEAIEDNSTPAQYHYRVFPDVLTFEGTENTASGRVREERQFAQLSIDDLYDVKRQEIGAQDAHIRYNAADTSLSGAWWIVVTERMRFELDGIQGNWNQRQIDGLGWPGGSNAPLVTVYNQNTGRVARIRIDDNLDPPTPGEDIWGTIYLEKTLHDQATGNATQASSDALDTKYAGGAGSWSDVAGHDPDDPAWGYPPVVELPPETRELVG